MSSIWPLEMTAVLCLYTRRLILPLTVILCLGIYNSAIQEKALVVGACELCDKGPAKSNRV